MCVKFTAALLRRLDGGGYARAIQIVVKPEARALMLLEGNGGIGTFGVKLLEVVADIVVRVAPGG